MDCFVEHCSSNNRNFINAPGPILRDEKYWIASSSRDSDQPLAQIVEMLTPNDILSRLDSLAEEVLHVPGLYDELFSRIFSDRVHTWIKTAPEKDAELIRCIAAQDPDYLSASELIAEKPIPPEPMFNPAWDVDY
jgi:hypothetical protein